MHSTDKRNIKETRNRLTLIGRYLILAHTPMSEKAMTEREVGEGRTGTRTECEKERATQRCYTANFGSMDDKQMANAASGLSG